MQKIHVGCGPHNLMEGWINVDIREFRGVDRVMDVTQEWPFRDVDYIYGEHFIEHLPLEGAIRFLTHAGRSLREGGVIRLTTPNLKWVIRTHYRLDTEFSDQERIAHVLKTNRAFYGWGHRFLYDRAFLRHLFEQLGYADIGFQEYGESGHEALRGVERHGGFAHGAGIPNLLLVEATRRGAIEPNPELLSSIRSEFLDHVHSGH